ncbi:MAG: hypothetical protein HY822_10025 [Acidobacteria bacterium]|nr:hypothetical protein [Acidobacteriota bacterium]
MHKPIEEGLEDFLRGNGSAAFVSHLDSCPECREDAGRMREQAQWVRLLRAEEELSPAPGFCARVMSRIEAQTRPPVWALLLDPAFGRRLMYASLTLVVLLGTYLVTTETYPAPVASTAAERYLAEQQPAVGANPQQDRDVVLVRLAMYGE